MTNFSDFPLKEPGQADFGFNNYSKAISDLILTSDTPVAMSISGDWGEGKTTLLNLVEFELKSKDNYNKNHLFIKFDAWKFTFSDNLNQIFLDFILSEIVKSNIIDKLNEEDKKGIYSSILSIIKIGGQVLGGYIKEKTGVNIDLNEVISNGGDFIKNRLINVKNIREDFEYIVEKILSEMGNDYKIVIAVDDLDRIDSVKAIEIIEIFKNYLNVKGVFFILIIDQEVIENGLARKFNLTTNEERKKYKKYFDKIIQIPFNIPEKINYEINDFSKFLKKVFGKKDYEKLFNNNKGAVLKKLLIDKNFLKGNPRAIKRYSNIYKLITNINNSVNIQDLFLITILQDFDDYQDAYEDLIINKNLDKNFILKDYCLQNELDINSLENLIKFNIIKDDYVTIKKLANITEKIEKYKWKSEIQNIINLLGKNEFELKELYIFEKELKAKFPNNNSIIKKIQQQVIKLKDEGVLASEEHGKYRILSLEI